MPGIHLHPHDIEDEGTERIFELIGRMGAVTHLFPEVNTIFERNPYPAGTLPHNPVRTFVQGEGTLHVPLDPTKLYPGLYQKLDPSVCEGADPLASLRDAASRGYEVVPWVNLMNGHFQGNLSANGVVDFRGRTVEHWLCPNGPDVAPMWIELLSALTERYGYSKFLIDRIRFPDWAGRQVRPQNVFSCFCRHCRAGMERSGLDPARLAAELEAVCTELGSQRFHEAVARFRQSGTIREWIAFRQNCVSAFIEELATRLKARNPQSELWLDLWPPSYAWLLGQDYGRLTYTSGVLKHFPYHKLGGGADVQGLIDCFAQDEASREQAFQAFLSFFGMEYELSYESFRQNGFPIRFVQDENDAVRALSKPGTTVFSGIQMWNIAPEDFRTALKAAFGSQADDVIYYCYGWADVELFNAARFP